MKLIDFRNEIAAHDVAHPELAMCIFPGCPHKIYPLWDSDVLCEEHWSMVEWWFYEKEGFRYCPDAWSMETGKKEPKPEGSDADMTAYRKRYCDWMAGLSHDAYLHILKHQIGDD